MSTFKQTAFLAVAALGFVLAAGSAQAAIYSNGVNVNGTNLNGVSVNGTNLNGAQAGGAAFDFDAVTVEAVELPDGIVLAVVPDGPE